MNKPIVAVVGRPNVGKSTLFNRLAGHRISIIDDTPGVTRDRLYSDAVWLNHSFTLIDTGGLEPETEDFIMKKMYEQAQIAIESADVIIFVVDVKTGVTDADADVANVLRRSKKPVVLAVNKVDNMVKNEMDAYEFYSLGLGEPIAISAGQLLGLGDLLDEVVKHFPAEADEQEDEDVIRVAIIGKPNVGKSSLVNRILGEERVLVSDIPGTTRDAVDSPYERNGRRFMLIDTAGMRRHSKITDGIEKFSIIRAIAAVERSDVCIIMIDAQTGITDQDTKIAGIAHEAGKACILVVNKWDAVEKDNKTMKNFSKTLDEELKYLSYAPQIYISALTGQRVDKLLDMVVAVSENAAMRVQTGVLNDVIIEAMAVTPPPTSKGRQLKVYFATQVSVKPPTFVLFVNDPQLMHFSYKRYIENKIYDAFGFMGTPIRFIVRDRKENTKGGN